MGTNAGTSEAIPGYDCGLGSATGQRLADVGSRVDCGGNEEGKEMIPEEELCFIDPDWTLEEINKRLRESLERDRLRLARFLEDMEIFRWSDGTGKIRQEDAIRIYKRVRDSN